ncbi:hypothetical protein ONE63_005965 [Megalurothrips usitatus]|uniref:Uncharacterized protein n=1 Tax=Megalurothrips usitatus TaxID=439358 RepID=A0AAV7XWT6_9NEOP|nr:hypothetical protein ONE63_005965 [Megalurothrips usitatus]
MTRSHSIGSATECHVVIEWPSTMFCPPGYAFPKTPTQIRTAWKTMLSILVIAAVVCGVVYLVRETSCLLRIRERVGRGRGGGTGYNHSPIVIYTADTQEEEEEEAERETFSM